MEREIFEKIMENAHGRLMTALENAIIGSTGVGRTQANLLANHLLDIIETCEEQEKR